MLMDKKKAKYNCPFKAANPSSCPFMKTIITIERDIKWIKGLLIPVIIGIILIGIQGGI